MAYLNFRGIGSTESAEEWVRRYMNDSKYTEMLNRFEQAAMAYERLGKMKKDDEKTRAIRKETIAELAAARKDIIDALENK